MSTPNPFQPGVSTGGAVLGPATAPAPAVKPVELVFSTTDKASAAQGVKMLVYGSAGVGKTWLCGTAPAPLIISAERGLLTLRRLKIPVIIVESIEEVRAAYKWCQANAKAQGIQTICLDSISEIVEKCLAHHRAKSKDPRMAYGDMANESIELVKQFRDLDGFHVLVTAKQTQITDPVTGVAKAAPTAPGKQVGPALPYLFDEIFHAYTDRHPTDGSTYHALRTKASFNAEAKDRSGVLDEIEFPDASNIISKILAAPKEV